MQPRPRQPLRSMQQPRLRQPPMGKQARPRARARYIVKAKDAPRGHAAAKANAGKAKAGPGG